MGDFKPAAETAETMAEADLASWPALASGAAAYYVLAHEIAFFNKQ